MKYILSLDQGTTSSRALLIDKMGQTIAYSQKGFRQFFPSPGWVEHDPNEIWDSQWEVILEVLKKANASPEEIASIGITNQRETTVVWEKKTGKPIHNALVWQDRRTADLCQKLQNEGLTSLFQKKTGLLLDPYFSGPKLQWILNHIPGSLERAKRGELAFGTVDSWLIWNLTQGKKHVTDATNASRTLLCNIHTGQWDDELLEILHIPKAVLPEIYDSSGVIGETSLFSPSIPISGIIGDQQGALLGQGCTTRGMAKTTYGTGCFLLMNTGDTPVESKNNLLTTIALQINKKREYALEGSVFTGGAVVQWLKENLGIIKTVSEIEKLASSVSDSHGVFFVPAFTGLGAPHWDPYARGTLLGITRGTTAAHIARAALEGIAFQVTDVLTAMEKDAGLSIQKLKVDGGGVDNRLLMQFQADLLGVPVVKPKMVELTAFGGAFLAGLAVGFWKELKEVSSFWKEDLTFVPQMSSKRVGQLKEKWNKAIECAQVWEDPNM